MDARPGVPFRPHPGPQTAFLASGADIVIYGGAAGGGKTWALLLEAARHVTRPDWRPVIFRRVGTQIRAPGGLWDKAGEIYPRLGAKPNRLDWVFPSGARVRLSHLQHESDRFRWQGSELTLVAWDELTHFTRSQFDYLSLSRARSTSALRPYTRATCNPDANSWVRDLLLPWVEQEAAPGELRFLTREGDSYVHHRERPSSYSQSLTFIRATLADNPTLDRGDPEYRARLALLPYVERLRLLEGDWNVIEAGNTFRREWLRIAHVGELSPGIVRACRYWDLAATRPRPGTDPDWTAGVLVGITQNRSLVILDVVRVRDTPAVTDRLMLSTAALDEAFPFPVMVRTEQEPGSAGVRAAEDLARLMAPRDFAVIRQTGDKAERARPLSQLAERGGLVIASAPWTRDFVNRLVAFPTPGVHDDEVDAASGAAAQLLEVRHTRTLVRVRGSA